MDAEKDSSGGGDCDDTSKLNHQEVSFFCILKLLSAPIDWM